jgi:hypothetical protein
MLTDRREVALELSTGRGTIRCVSVHLTTLTHAAEIVNRSDPRGSAPSSARNQ